MPDVRCFTKKAACRHTLWCPNELPKLQIHAHSANHLHSGLHAVGSVAVDYGGAVLLTDVLLDLALCLRPAAPNQQQQQSTMQQQPGVILSDSWLDGLPHGWRLWGWRQHAPPNSQSHSSSVPQPDPQLRSGSAQGEGAASGVDADRESGAELGVGMTARSEAHRRAGAEGLNKREEVGSDGLRSQHMAAVAQEAASLMALLLGSPSHGTAVALLMQVRVPMSLSFSSFPGLGHTQ
eukprot:scaffold174020_cov15-Tisochrysis_lutea.AAC.1